MSFSQKSNVDHRFASQRSDSISSTSSISSVASFLPKAPIGIGDSPNLEWKQDNKCYVCLKKFGLGSRHHCRYCGNSVCKKHSMVKQIEDVQEKTRICDNCDVELIKNKIRSDILEEIAALRDNIEITKESLNKAEAERYEKNQKVLEIEEELMKAEKEFRKREEELQSKLAEEQAKSQQNNDFLDCITKNLDLSHKNENEMTHKFMDIEKKTEDFRNEAVKQKQIKTELFAQLEHDNNKIKNSLPIDVVKASLCDKCRQRITVNGPSNDDSVIST